MLCQKNQTDCKDIVMYFKNASEWLFILFNIRPEAFNLTYGCEFTLKINDQHRTKKGTPTTLIQAQKQAECKPPPPQPLLAINKPPPPPPPQPHQDNCKHQSHKHDWTPLEFILIGLLALTLLYSCVLTSCFIRKRMNVNTNEPENTTYVEMRTAPLSGQPQMDMPYELLPPRKSHE
ncbi:uncharacterized protein LOC117819767 [Xyrichtys novacula]|nr:uncharacterized protein LOC117819767 [Xyrichtys novacula]